MTDNHESPYLTLNTLLQNRSSEILRLEQINNTFIHLYAIGSYKVAFERSAYILCTVCPMAEIYPIQLKDCPFPIVMASISYKEAGNTVDKLPLTEKEGRRQTYAAAMPSLKGYSQWHKSQVDIFSD